MPDVMMFPDTVEEFMESYKMVDSEHVYSNGVEFVPIYRMRQWFQHRPERKTGMWLFPYGDKKYKRCSVCERDYYSIPHNSNFCPNCGADMRGET